MREEKDQKERRWRSKMIIWIQGDKGKARANSSEALNKEKQNYPERKKELNP